MKKIVLLGCLLFAVGCGNDKELDKCNSKNTALRGLVSVLSADIAKLRKENNILRNTKYPEEYPWSGTKCPKSTSAIKTRIRVVVKKDNKCMSDLIQCKKDSIRTSGKLIKSILDNAVTYGKLKRCTTLFNRCDAFIQKLNGRPKILPLN